MIPLKIAGVFAPMSCAIWRIAGGTAEVNLRPDWGEGVFYFWKENLL